ncbi:hypothetical protein AVEN_59862-1 [Araneus ventricosus]|uniref:Uncharacterized protein n=1 Tax=Araneus ventricosus TaxID=182803 RepID=A0A4Y2FF76_ARAVE|nr:hypothetical protein AVEN_59862-1 [Araneus ventricosus]
MAVFCLLALATICSFLPTADQAVSLPVPNYPSAHLFVLKAPSAGVTLYDTTNIMQNAHQHRGLEVETHSVSETHLSWQEPKRGKGKFRCYLLSDERDKFISRPTDGWACGRKLEGRRFRAQLLHAT